MFILFAVFVLADSLQLPISSWVATPRWDSFGRSIRIFRKTATRTLSGKCFLTKIETAQIIARKRRFHLGPPKSICVQLKLTAVVLFADTFLPFKDLAAAIGFSHEI